MKLRFRWTDIGAMVFITKNDFIMDWTTQIRQNESNEFTAIKNEIEQRRN